jgi:putative membrane protein
MLLRRADDSDDENGALAVLRERYAAGDIDDEEFDRRRQRLQGGSSS